MPTLKPFAGIRYSGDAIADLVCPPYDVISSDEQDRLHERHPNNAIRLELARPDDGSSNPYDRVGELFARWKREGILVEEAKPALYVYRQDFSTDDGARHRVAGVLGALELEEFGDSAGVLPHERTMAGPKLDRLTLMRACPVNISPIYAIYRGQGLIAPYLDSLANRPPSVRFQDDGGILHRLWVIAAPAEIEMLSDAIAHGPLVIADGHHRYETALAFHREKQAEGSAGDHGSIMCFCVDADAEDLVVLPYNRAVRSSETNESVIQRLVEGFSARVVGDDSLADLDRQDSDHPFLFAFANETYLASATDADVVAVTGDRHIAWRSLDVVALHEVVLPRILGGAEAGFDFSRDPNEIVASVRTGQWDFGVLLRALQAAEVVDVASSGERMPQKASYFWPKAITGLVFHSLS